MVNIDDYFTGLALGVRFRANFSIEDQMGSILDRILYSKNSYFNPAVFPKVKNSIGSKVLFNEDTQSRIHIDNSNIILDINFSEEKGFIKNNTGEILQKFEEQILKNILVEYKIKEIVRIGYIKRYVYPISELANTFVNKTIGNTLGGINDINLSFSKKFVTPEAQVQKDINDFDNAIFNVVKKADLDEIFMSIDYQKYYHPFLISAADIKLKQFIDRAELFNKGNYVEWLNRNYLEAENA